MGIRIPIDGEIPISKSENCSTTRERIRYGKREGALEEGKKTLLSFYWGFELSKG
jgi:hypothetical protein